MTAPEEHQAFMDAFNKASAPSMERLANMSAEEDAKDYRFMVSRHEAERRHEKFVFVSVAVVLASLLAFIAVVAR